MYVLPKTSSRAMYTEGLPDDTPFTLLWVGSLLVFLLGVKKVLDLSVFLEPATDRS